MSVTNIRNGQSEDMLNIGFCMSAEVKAPAADAVLSANSAPVQLITPGAAINLGLPAEEATVTRNGKIFIIRNLHATNVITVRDDSPATIAAIAGASSGIFHLWNGAWRCLSESAAIA